MKTSKRFLASVIAVMLVLTSFVTVPAFAAFTDVTKEHSAYEAVDVLSKLGIINGYEEDGKFSFKPDNNVTRAEFTAMLLRTRGMGSVGSLSLENPPFPDVVTPDVSWAIGNIRTAKELGIINGYEEDGNFIFKPNNNVSYEEAVKMIVCALGYGEMNPEGAQWYSKYITSATTLGFLKGAGGAIGTPATRATIAGMLYNCLEVNLAENNQITDKTILKDDLKLTKNVGYIAATPEISLLEANSNLREDEIQIVVNNISSTYKVENMDDYKDMLGAEITFYYTIDRQSGFNELLMAQVEKSETIEISADMIYGCTSSAIEYTNSADSDRTIKAGIDANCLVVYNGKLYGSTAANSKFSDYCAGQGTNAMPTIGNIKLLDRNGDRNYDVAFIDSYDAWVVSSKTSSNSTIVDNVLRKGLADNKLALSDTSIKFYDMSGNESNFSSIATGNVLCVKKSNAGNGAGVLTSVIICKNAFSGKVSGTSSKNGYTISGKTYKSSLQAPWKNVIPGASPVTDAPEMGDSGKFYLDCNGNILAFDKTQAASNQQYGILIGAAQNSDGFESVTQVQFVSKANIKGKVYNLSKDAKLIDGANTYSYDSVLANLTTGGTAVYKFTTNSKGEIEEIIACEAVNAGQDITAEKLYKYTPTGSDDTYKYNSSNLVSDDEKIYIGQAIIIRVPATRTNVNDYKNWTTGSFAADKDGYKVEFYDVTTTKSAKVVLVTEIPSSQTAVEDIKPNSPVLVLTESPVFEDGKCILEGYNGKTGGTKYTIADPDDTTKAVLDVLAVGDVVRIGGNSSDGYIIKPEYVLFGVEQSAARTAAGISYSFGYNDKTKPGHRIEGQSSFETIYGKAHQKPIEGDDRFVIDTGLDGKIEVLKGKFGSAQIFVYDTTAENKKFEAIADSFNEVYDSSYMAYAEDNTGATPSDVFIHEVNGTIKTMIIVKY